MMRTDYQDKLDAARELMLAAIAEHSPKHIIGLLSGGHDSLSVVHFAASVAPLTVAHIDTGIGIKETRQFVRDVCEKYGWPLRVYRAEDYKTGKGEPAPQRYRDLVMRWGFPGTSGHTVMYNRLKERQIHTMRREHDGLVMAISGIRRAESSRRMRNIAASDPVHMHNGILWVAPFHDFTKEDQERYFSETGLPRNPVKDCLGMSGECLCGAFAKPGELDRIRQHYPETAAHIEEIEKDVIAAGHPWGWEDSVPGWYTKRKVAAEAGQVDAFDLERDEVLVRQGFRPLCTGCEGAYSG